MKQFTSKFLCSAKTAVAMSTAAFASIAPSYAQTEGQQILNEATTGIKGLGQSLVSFLKVIVILGGLVSLAMVIFKIMKGDREAGEKAAWWVAGFTLGFILIQVVSNRLQAA